MKLPGTLVRDPAAGPRLDGDELLDTRGHDPSELAESLEQIRQVNRWLGGFSPLRTHLDRIDDGGDGLRILDVGTGDGALPRALVRWAGQRGRRWEAVGLDLHPEIVRLARGAVVPVLRADGRRLPFRAGSFDVVLCTLTLHHLADRDAVRLLGEMGRVARRRVLVSDLERRRANYLGALLLAATLWRGNRLTRHDGPLSVLRSFTLEELEAAGRDAGLREVRVRRHFPFRLVLDARPAGSPG